MNSFFYVAKYGFVRQYFYLYQCAYKVVFSLSKEVYQSKVLIKITQKTKKINIKRQGYFLKRSLGVDFLSNEDSVMQYGSVLHLSLSIGHQKFFLRFIPQ